MISKVITPAKSFERICRYLLDKRQDAKVLLEEGVRSYSHSKMAEDFIFQASTNPNLSSPVQHIILSFPPGENLSDEKLAEIAGNYLEEMHLNDTQYVVISHQDKLHTHLHIVLNRVGNNGKTINDHFLGLRGKKKAQELTRRHGLVPANHKELKRTNTQAMNLYEQTRYEIYKAICTGVTNTGNLNELEAYLKKQEIETIYKYKSKSNEVQGLSFKKGEYRFKASDIDRRFSYNNLQKIYAHGLQQSHSLKPGWLGNISGKEHALFTEILDILLKQDECIGHTQVELLKKKRKKSNGRKL